MDNTVVIKEVPENIIEKYFYESTKFRSDGNKLRKIWAIDKHYFSKETEITVLEFEHYSLHDKTHSNCILNSIALLLGEEKLCKMKVADLWLLMEVAYCHDIGMAISNHEIIELWTKNNDFREFLHAMSDSDNEDIQHAIEYISQIDSLINGEASYTFVKDNGDIEIGKDWPIEIKRSMQIIVAEYIRKEHCNRTKKKIYEYADNNRDLEPRLYRTIADIAALHGGSFNEIFLKLQKEEVCFGDCHMHPQFIAALLRMGDLLDMDNNRFSEHVINHFGVLPATSALHLKKHKSLKCFNITPTQIIAEAESNEVEVCVEIAKWYKWLADENTDLISNWNLIAPPELDGCTLSNCNLKINLHGEEFSLVSNGTFEIDKQHAVKLLIGDNLYQNKLDFLREYIQNAQDASKVEIDKELKKGELDYLMDLKEEEWNDSLPFSFHSDIFSKFEIKIHLTVENDMLIVSVRDAGIGIEEKGLSSLITIGKGWRERKHFLHMDKMIPWLKPTAGFGIGIQAAFMITDNVEFKTKSRSESKGFIVNMTDPRKSGKVICQTSNELNNGTEVIIKIPLWVFMDGDLFDDTGDTTYSTDVVSIKSARGDMFLKDNLLKIITDEIKRYIENQLVNSLIPISVESYNYKPSTIFSKYWYNDPTSEKDDFKRSFRNFQKVENEKGKYFSVSHNSSSIFVYDANDMTLTCIEFLLEKNRLFKYCFKGIGVIDEYENRIFFSGMIDMLNDDVADVLKMNRREFIEKIKKDYIAKDKIRMSLYLYVKYIGKTYMAQNSGKKEQPILKVEQLENILYSILWYLNGEEIRELKEIIQFLLSKLDVFPIKYKYIGKHPEDNTSVNDTFFSLVFRAIFDNELLVIEKQNINNGEQILSLNGLEKENIGPEKTKIRKLISNCYAYILPDDGLEIQTLNAFYGNNSCVIKYKDTCLKIYGITFRLDDEDELYGKVDFASIQTAYERKIYINPIEYPILHVSKIPFTKQNPNNTEMLNYLVIPINDYVTKLFQTEIEKNGSFSNAYHIFESSGKEADTFNRLVKWTYFYQASKNKYSSDKIREQYKLLLHDYYNYIKEHSF